MEVAQQQIKVYNQREERGDKNRQMTAEMRNRKAITLGTLLSLQMNEQFLLSSTATFYRPTLLVLDLCNSESTFSHLSHISV